MKRSKGKIIAAVAVLAVLAFSFFAGGDVNQGTPSQSSAAQEKAYAEDEYSPSEESIPAPAEKIGIPPQTDKPETPAETEEPTPPEEPPSLGQEASAAEKTADSDISLQSPAPEQAENEPSPKPSASESEKESADIESHKSAPPTCSLTIRCDTLLSGQVQIPPEKAELIPENGILLMLNDLPFTEGESVFDLLQRETKSRKFHFEYMQTPLYNSVYIEGLGNLYEFDCGPLSGWVYQVNGSFPGHSCSQHPLADGDRIVFMYTCDAGADVGGNNGPGGVS